MKTYVIANQKGGVGKSTTALALGAGFQNKGKSVLFVDLDAQGNLSYVMEADQSNITTLTLLHDPKIVKEGIQKTKQGDILPASPALAGTDMSLTGEGREYRLKEALQGLKKRYDICIVDTPPALGILTVNGLAAGTHVVIPAQADIFSLQGIGQLSQTIATVKEHCNQGLNIEGILLTRYNGRAVISRDVAETLRDTAIKLNSRLFDSKIRECTALKEAQATRQSIFDYAPKSNAAIDYQELVDEITKGRANSWRRKVLQGTYPTLK